MATRERPPKRHRVQLGLAAVVEGAASKREARRIAAEIVAIRVRGAGSDRLAGVGIAGVADAVTLDEGGPGSRGLLRPADPRPVVDYSAELLAVEDQEEDD